MPHSALAATISALPKPGEVLRSLLLKVTTGRGRWWKQAA